MKRKNGKPEFAVIGLGRFGTSLALTLAADGHHVLGIDRNRQIVQQLADRLTQAIALDSTDEEALRAAGIAAFDTVIVAIGADFENNLMTTVGLKNLGVRRIICKALTEKQKAILLAVGANRVVLPESEAGRRLAHELTIPGILDQLTLDADHSIVELTATESYVGRTLRDLDLRRRFGTTVLAVRRGDQLIVSPSADEPFQEGDILITIGANGSLARLCQTL